MFGYRLYSKAANICPMCDKEMPKGETKAQIHVNGKFVCHMHMMCAEVFKDISVKLNELNEEEEELFK